LIALALSGPDGRLQVLGTSPIIIERQKEREREAGEIDMLTTALIAEKWTGSEATSWRSSPMKYRLLIRF
jgi:hypothetical protein